jgi:serine protease AprX
VTIKKFLFLLGLSGVVVLSLYAQSSAGDKIRVRPGSLQSDSVKVWVFFHDKGNSLIPLSKKAAVNDKAMRRRVERGGIADYDACDREVNSEYIAQIVPLVNRVAHESRWLNAISAWTKPSGLAQLTELEFVDSVKEVAVFIRKPEPIVEADTMRFLKPESPYPPDYGLSYAQSAQIEVDQLHNRGLTGNGITILMLDTGFKISHAAFARMKIDSTWDFIHNDVNVEDPNDSSEIGYGTSQQSHGTATLSIIGGYDYGNMIGVAYDADFLLAKTEITGQEIKAEEDNWVAGIEWGERLGADVVSSSLGYDNWYTWEDMDGQTATCTIAADSAARLGMIVVNAAGNEGRTSQYPTIIAPADGDSVIAVGAVTLGGEISSFSSNGPTFDGRIKPDICAMGVNDRIASQTGGYGNGSGTSFATPLVAGTCALLLQAHPDWHYGDLYRAITSTATKAVNPDTVYGYGIIRAYQALNYWSGTGKTISGVVAAPNPFTGFVDFVFSPKTAGEAKYRIYDIAGEKIAEKSVSFEASSSPYRFSWDGQNSKGDQAAAGVYIVYFASPGIETTLKIFKKE